MGNNVSEIRNMYGTVKSITNFTNKSAKRKEIAMDAFGENGGRSLVTLCDTRFVERNNARLVFTEQYTTALQALDNIALQCKDRKTVDNAKTDPTFIFALCCAQKVMVVTIVLSRTLQTVNKDLFEAMRSVEHVSTTLQRWREGADDNGEEDP